MPNIPEPTRKRVTLQESRRKTFLSFLCFFIFCSFSWLNYQAKVEENCEIISGKLNDDLNNLTSNFAATKDNSTAVILSGFLQYIPEKHGPMQTMILRLSSVHMRTSKNIDSDFKIVDITLNTNCATIILKLQQTPTLTYLISAYTKVKNEEFGFRRCEWSSDSLFMPTSNNIQVDSIGLICENTSVFGQMYFQSLEIHFNR